MVIAIICQNPNWLCQGVNVFKQTLLKGCGENYGEVNSCRATRRSERGKECDAPYFDVMQQSDEY